MLKAFDFVSIDLLKTVIKENQKNAYALKNNSL